MVKTVKNVEPLLLHAPPTNTTGGSSSANVVVPEEETQFEQAMSDIGTPPPQTQETPTKPENEVEKIKPASKKKLFRADVGDQNARDTKKQKKE